MKEILSLVLAALAAITLSGCKNCKVDQVVSSGLAAGITKIGSCPHPDAVRRITDKWMGTEAACSAVQKGRAGGPIGSFVCPLFVSAIVDYAGNLIPKELETEGGCDFSSVEGGLAGVLSLACNVIPLAPAPQAAADPLARVVSTDPVVTHGKGAIPPMGWKRSAKFKKVKVRHAKKGPALPQHFSLADKYGYLPPVKDQGACGSCWQFGTVAQVELSYWYRDGVYIDLSEQEGLSCSRSGSCNGGWYAFDYFKAHGQTLEETWPYVSGDGRDRTCRRGLTPALKIADWGYIGTQGRAPQVDEVKAVLQSGQAVACTVTADARFEAYHKGYGVFKGSRRPGATNHIVAVVAWDDAKEAWLVRNQWRASWGEDGYIWMRYGANRICETATWIELIAKN